MSAEKLKHLLEDLRAHREGAPREPPQEYETRFAAVREALADVPLFHGTSQQHLPAIWERRRLESRKSLGLDALEHQLCFDTYEAVYACAGIMYPSRQAAIAFASRVETAPNLRVDSSPWDTGAFFKHVAPRLGLHTSEAKLAFFQRHTLAAPHYRQYLVAYVSTCFTCAQDYVKSVRYRCADPDGIMSTSPQDDFLRVFEVRVHPSLPVRSDDILAVFLPSPRYLTKVVREQIVPELQKARIMIKYYGRLPRRGVKPNPGPDDLRRFVTDWMCTWIQEQIKP